jgi:hypothetical protein
MKAILVSLMAAMLAGCVEQTGRYQIVPINYTEVWRIDTVTGDIGKCLHFGGNTKATCSYPPK